MASAEVPVVIGEQFVDAAKQAVEKALAPFRAVGEYYVAVNVHGWMYLAHVRCDKAIHSLDGARGHLDAGVLFKEILDHECPHGIMDLGGYAASITFTEDENGNPQPQWPSRP